MVSDKALRTAQAQARRVARINRGLIPQDDLTSECYVWLVKHEAKVEQWEQEGRRGQAKLVTALYRAAQDYASKERARLSRTMPGDHYYYTPAVLQDLLPDIWDYEAWGYPSQAVDTQPRGKSQPSEGFNRQAMIVDVKWAVAGLPAEDQTILRNIYEGGGMSLTDAGYLFGLTEDGMRRRHNRILEKVCDRLGGQPPWYQPGRRARSNAASQSETRSQTAE